MKFLSNQRAAGKLSKTMDVHAHAILNIENQVPLANRARWSVGRDFPAHQRSAGGDCGQASQTFRRKRDASGQNNRWISVGDGIRAGYAQQSNERSISSARC
jgi:hypothetical protein